MQCACSHCSRAVWTTLEHTTQVWRNFLALQTVICFISYLHVTVFRKCNELFPWKAAVENKFSQVATANLLADWELETIVKMQGFSVLVLPLFASGLVNWESWRKTSRLIVRYRRILFCWRELFADDNCCVFEWRAETSNAANSD